MPYDEVGFGPRADRKSLRAAVLELMERTASLGQRDDVAYRAALCELVAHSRDRADDLWLKYHGDRTDARARAYAKYSY